MSSSDQPRPSTRPPGVSADPEAGRLADRVARPAAALSDGGCVALALGAWLAAVAAPPVPLALAALGLVAALAARRPTLVVLTVALLVGGLAHRSWAGVDPVGRGRFEATVTLASDPAPVPGGVRAEVVAGDRRLDARAWGGAAGALRQRLAGERVLVAGTSQPLAAHTPRSVRARHLAGRLTITEVHGWQPGPWWSRAANGVRRHLLRGARDLPAERRSLLAGLVLGDDRDQRAELQQAFAAAGLSHLLAVSGQNVAFVLTAMAPVLGRLGSRRRLLATVALLAFFATCTRFEPSVLRAVVMAGLAATGLAAGRPASSVRVLALAVTALLVADPLLVWRAGFQLSVLATLGIVVGSAPVATWLRSRLRLPGPLALPIGVTIAAQAATAPLLAAQFEPVPVASLVANLLAEPAAAAAMVWGVVGGLAAGFLPALLARLVHVPTQLLTWWLAGVARWSAGLPLPSLGLGPVLGLWAVGLAAYGRSRRRAARQRVVSRAVEDQAIEAAHAAVATSASRATWAIVGALASREPVGERAPARSPRESS